MKVDFPSLAITAGLVMHITPPATATPAVLRSPETVQTYADNSILWRQLRWWPASSQLVATITFSNIDYVSRVEPRHDETFTFPLPGVKFTAKTGTFYVSGPQGEAIPVARLRRGLIGQTVELLPTTRMLVTNRSGRVAVRLVTSQPPSAGDLWVER
jgi:hypothetical protein